jgi:hypothetical protein
MSPQSSEQPSHPHSEPQQNQYDYYFQLAKAQLDKYGRDFSEFAKGQDKLVKIGDEILKKHQATGYNIILKASDMPLITNEMYIFYNNYIGRPRHFALILSEMEESGIISRNQVSLGVKGSKVLFDEDKWKIDSENESSESIDGIDENGNLYKQMVNRNVETIIIFNPRDELQSINIAQFLLDRTNANKPNAIEGSWTVPDIRATQSLEKALGGTFTNVVANILRDDGSILVARQESEFPIPWESVGMGINPELASYLVSSTFGVKP